MFEKLKKTDPEIYEAIVNETKRQNENIELIASENFTDLDVLETGRPGTRRDEANIRCVQDVEEAGRRERDET